MRSRVVPSPVYPSVTIGVPVYNGADYLELALNSLFIQDYPNLEIFISDNHSSDGSWDIAHRFAACDDRIRLHRHHRNIGAIENFRSVLLNSDARYFMWAAHDDLWPAGFVTKAVEALESNQEVVMVTGRTEPIDQDGRPMELPATRPQLVDLRGCNYFERISELAMRVGWCLYGLARRECLLDTSLFHGTIEATFDVIMTYELAGMGTFMLLDDMPFSYRIFQDKTLVKVVESLGISDQASRNLFSKMFSKCWRAIVNAPVREEERKAGVEAFVGCCASHAEWWPCISTEQGWADEQSVCRRMEKLRLIGGII